MQRYISKPDSDRFGFPVARIDHFPGPVAAGIEQFREMGVGLVISLAPAGEIALVNEMEQAGFRLKDVHVTYDFGLDRKPPRRSAPGAYRYRKFRPEDTGALLEIAATSFAGYGHYSRLERPLAPVDTGVIYADWLRRCCREREAADHLIVAERQGEVVGFLALKIGQDTSPGHAVAVLGAVAPRHRGLGVYRALNIEALRWAARKGLARMEQRVLVHNYAANRTISALGFTILCGDVTLHCRL